MHLPLGLLSHLSSLTIPKQQRKKATETSHRKFSEGKQVHVGMKASKTNQTRWGWHHNTFTASLHLVPFANYVHRKTLYMYLAYLCIE